MTTRVIRVIHVIHVIHVIDAKLTEAFPVAVRTLCKFRRRTASGPEGSSAQLILHCAAGPPGRDLKRLIRGFAPRTPCSLTRPIHLR